MSARKSRRQEDLGDKKTTQVPTPQPIPKRTSAQLTQDAKTRVKRVRRSRSTQSSADIHALDQAYMEGSHEEEDLRMLEQSPALQQHILDLSVYAEGRVFFLLPLELNLANVNKSYMRTMMMHCHASVFEGMVQDSRQWVLMKPYDPEEDRQPPSPVEPIQLEPVSTLLSLSAPSEQERPLRNINALFDQVAQEEKDQKATFGTPVVQDIPSNRFYEPEMDSSVLEQLWQRAASRTPPEAIAPFTQRPLGHSRILLNLAYRQYQATVPLEETRVSFFSLQELSASTQAERILQDQPSSSSSSSLLSHTILSNQTDHRTHAILFEQILMWYSYHSAPFNETLFQMHLETFLNQPRSIHPHLLAHVTRVLPPHLEHQVDGLEVPEKTALLKILMASVRAGQTHQANEFDAMHKPGRKVPDPRRGQPNRYHLANDLTYRGLPLEDSFVQFPVHAVATPIVDLEVLHVLTDPFDREFFRRFHPFHPMYTVFLRMLMEDTYHLGLRRLYLAAVAYLVNRVLQLSEQQLEEEAKAQRVVSDQDELKRIWIMGREMLNDPEPDVYPTATNKYNFHCGRILRDMMASPHFIEEFKGDLPGPPEPALAFVPSSSSQEGQWDPAMVDLEDPFEIKEREVKEEEEMMKDSTSAGGLYRGGGMSPPPSTPSNPYELTKGWSNWSRSLQSATSPVYKPWDEKALIEFVKQNAAQRTPMHLRPFSAGHAYADVMVSDNTTLVDLRDFNKMSWTDETYLVVQPGALLEDILGALEKKGRTLWNMTGCLNLSIGGCLAAASHGSGYKATIAEGVSRVQLLKADGTIVPLTKTHPDFTYVIGSMGALGLLLRIELETIPISIYQDNRLKLTSALAVATQLQKDASQLGHPGDATQFFWIPLADTYLYFQRRMLPQAEQKEAIVNYESALGKLEDIFEGVGAKLLNGARTSSLTSPQQSFDSLDSIFTLTLKSMPTTNSLYQLALPLAHQARSLRDSFEVSQDCELFFPFARLQDVFDVYNGLYAMILGPNFNWEAQEYPRTKAVLVKHKLVTQVKTLAHPKALFTEPLLCRYLPATEVGIMAPNYKQARVAISFTWFGERAHMFRYNQAMDLFIKLGVAEFNAKVHLGKYHTVQPFLKAQYQTSLLAKKIKEYDPRGVYQNRYLQSWFGATPPPLKKKKIVPISPKRMLRSKLKKIKGL